MLYRPGNAFVSLALLTCLLCLDCSDAEPAQDAGRLALSFADNETTASAKMGQLIEITLQTIGPGHYETPFVSSSAIRFLDVSIPPKQNPGGPTQVFRFQAVQGGSATITIEHTETNHSFKISVNVQ